MPRVLIRRSLLVAAAAVVGSFAAAAAGAQKVRPGARAPEINLKTLDGKRVRLSEFRGHPVVLTLWATWCPSCRTEFPELVALYHRSHKDGLEVLAVNFRDQELNDADVERFVAQYAVPFPVVSDPRGSSRWSYGPIALPTTVFIDSAGVIRGIHSGALPADELRRNVALIHSVP